MTAGFKRGMAALALVGIVASTGAACGTEEQGGVAAKNIKALPADLVTGPVLGLEVTAEDVSQDVTNQDENNAYIAAVGLYALRKNEQLEATLQVSKFTDTARPKSKSFQNQIATQIGGQKAQLFRMGEHDIYRSSGRKQSISSWFTGDYYFVLSVREAYDTPRTLLRTLLTDVRPK